MNWPFKEQRFKFLNALLKEILVLLVVIFAFLVNINWLILPSLATSSGITTEIYLSSSQSIPSEEPNTLSIDEERNINIVLGNEKIEIKKSNQKEVKPLYLTIKYLTTYNKLSFYEDGNKIKDIFLPGKVFNVRDFLEDLKSKHVQKQIAYFKSTHVLLDKRRIIKNYKRNIHSIKTRSQVNKSFPEKNLLAQMFVQDHVVTNGLINSIVISNGITYIGGGFTMIGQNTGNGLPINIATGLAQATFSKVNNTIWATVPDGSGGWYIGGDFTLVGGVSRNRIAHILSDGTVDANWNPNSNNQIRSLALSGTNLYVGGSFTTIGGQARNNLAAIDTTTGNATTWNPNPNRNVYAIALSGSIVYIGGEFSTVGGQTRNSLAAVDATTGNPTNLSVAFNDVVYALAVSGNTLFVGGYFTSPRARLASFDITTGSLKSWSPNLDQGIFALAVSGSNLHAGGAFTNIEGQTRNRLASFDIATESLTNWNPNANDSVFSLGISGSNLFVGGAFKTIGGQSRNNLAAFDISSGNVTSWDPNLSASGIRTIATNSSYIYAGGNVSTIGGQNRNYLAAIDSTGAITSWNPNASGYVKTLLVTGSTIYAGGSFTTIGGLSRNRLAAIDASGNVTIWNPNVDGPVYTLAASSSTLYAGGSFTTVGGQARNNLAAFDLASGSLTSWSPGAAASNVNALVTSTSTLYVGGGFTTISGQSRSNFAAFDLATGNLKTWNPDPSSSVNALALSGSTLYLGGSFTTIAGQTRSRLASLDTTGETLTSFNPSPSGGSFITIIKVLTVNGSTLYVGGDFTTIAGQARTNLATFDVPSGTLTSWTPNPDKDVSAISASGSTLYVGGAFQAIDNNVNPNLAKYTIVPANQEPNIPSISSATINSAASNTLGNYNLNVGQTLVVNFTSSDTDSSQNVTLSTPQIPSVGTFTPAISANPGTATYTFTPNSSHVGSTYNFSVRATDNNSTPANSSSDLTITITVQSPPAIPSIVSANVDSVSKGNSGTYNINSGQTITISFTSADPDSSQNVTLSTPQTPSVGIFTPATPANPGTATYTFTPNSSHAGNIYNFNVRATDSTNQTSSSILSVSITVNAIFGTTTGGGNSGSPSPPRPASPGTTVVNSAPAKPSIIQTTIDGIKASTNNIEVGQTLVINFISLDLNKSDLVTLSTPIAPTVGTFISNTSANPGTAIYTFKPNESNIGQTYTFSVRATDHNGKSSLSDLNVLFTVVQSDKSGSKKNAPPSVPSILKTTIDGMSSGLSNFSVGQTLVIDFTSLDPNQSDVITLYTPIAPTVGIFIPKTPSNPGTATYTFTPNESDAGKVYTFTVKATDNFGMVSINDLHVSIIVSSLTSGETFTIGGNGTGETKPPKPPKGVETEIKPGSINNPQTGDEKDNIKTKPPKNEKPKKGNKNPKGGKKPKKPHKNSG